MGERIKFTKFNRFHNPRTLEDKFWEKVDRKSPDECWLWLASLNKDGYGCFASDVAHRVSWLVNFGEIPRGMYVLHKCDVCACVNPSHLFLGTQLDNMRDMKSKGRARDKFGEDNPKAKLTELQVRDIHSLYKSGESGVFLSKKFGVTKTHIYYILSGKSWKYVYDEVNKWLPQS